METTEEEVRRLFKLRDVYLYIKSLDAPVNEESDTLLEDFIPDEKNSLEEIISLGLLKEHLEKILGTLTEREREVLILRFGLEDGKERTLEEVGKFFCRPRRGEKKSAELFLRACKRRAQFFCKSSLRH